MTILEEPTVAPVAPAAPVSGELDVLESSLLGEKEEGTAHGEAGPEGAGEEDKPVKASMVAAAAALTCLGAAWIVTRIFHGAFAPMAVATLGVGIGVGIVYLSYRLGKGGVLQYAVVPVAVVAGAVLATTGEVAGRSLPSAIMDAFRGGGLLQPPIPFDPGWRFLMVVLFAFLGAAATTTAISMARPKLAVAIPVPVVLGAALLQPKGSEIVASGVAIVFVVAGLALAYGADLAAEGVGGAGFEARRLFRGVGLLVFALAALVLISQTNFLFPSTEKNQVIPPQRPPPPQPEADRVLFTGKMDRPGTVPWRLGVLDVYKDNAFMLPPVEPKRMVKVPKDGVVHPVPGRPTYTATFTITDMKGQVLPAPQDPSALGGLKKKAEFDPRTQVFKLVETSLPHGLTYSVTAPLPPTAQEMAAAPAPPADIAREFLPMPPAPPGVRDLLSRAPTGNQFERLQFVRQALYEHVVAAGAGRPGDIPPSKVDEFLNGGAASPFEINAAEVMLARWAGIPSRLGFGFFGGDVGRDGTVSFRPRHGAAWLESYFSGYGWVPILGTPPRARPNLTNTPQRHDPRIVPTDELALTVFVPVRMETVQLLFEIVRWYVKVFAPIVLAVLLLLFAYPAGVKLLRSSRRRKWAVARGAPARVVVAYAEFRDKLHDLNVGNQRATPIEFLSAVADDDEHGELAWLFTRALWGDLARDLRIEDVEAAEEMARSVNRRVQREQSALNRVLAATSRASLRDPWTDEVPNLWRAAPDRPNLVRSVLRVPRRLVPRRIRGRVAAAAATTAMTLFLGACGGSTGPARPPSTYPDPLMPATTGPYDVAREPKAELEFAKAGGRSLVLGGEVFTVRDGDTIQGSVEVAVFKPNVDAQTAHVQEGVQKGLGTTAGFHVTHHGLVQLRTLETTEQTVFLWFPPERNVMELFIMRKKFADADKVVLDIVNHQRGLTVAGVWS